MTKDAPNATADGALAGRLMSDATQKGNSVSEEKLAAFLARQSDLGGRLLRVRIDTTPRAAGASSGTVLFDADLELADGALQSRSLVFRYDLGGAFFKQYALAPQFWTMRALFAAGFLLPEALWLDEAGEIAGKPGLIMARVSGQAPTTTPFVDGPLMAAPPAQRHEMLLNAARMLARLHSAEVGAFKHLESRGTGETFIARDINWVLAELRSTLSALRGSSKAAFYVRAGETLEGIGRYLMENAPRRAPELAHGDANITNFMYDGARVAVLLDYELTHIGLGEADLGYQLAGLSHFQLLAPRAEGVPSDDEMIAAYRAARGKLEDWPYARLMGEWRHAVFATMGMSRLPPELDHVERAYWDAAIARMHRIAPDVVPAEVRA